MFDKNRLRIAIQKSGRLSDESQKLLKRCGLKINVLDRRLIAHVENMPIDILRVRDDDIPGLVMDGVCDLGIIGENVLDEEKLEREFRSANASFDALSRLDFGGCRLSIAVPEEMPYLGSESLQGLTIATTYPRLLERYLASQNIQAQIVCLKGSVEVAPRAGLADAICDLVSTGATLDANGLKEAEVIYRSKAALIQNPGLLNEQKQALVDTLLPRIQSVMQAKESKYIMLHAPKANLAQITDLLPGAENPTVLPLAEDESRVALHAVSSETLFWETMEALKAQGASSILVMPIEKMMG